MEVARITTDRINFGEAQHNQGRTFDFEVIHDWWGWGNDPIQLSDIEKLPKTKFKLYDDDNELYYEGWLLNDDNCIVQQFVLDWAKYDSGCTLIEVWSENTKTWTVEIG